MTIKYIKKFRYNSLFSLFVIFILSLGFQDNALASKKKTKNPTQGIERIKTMLIVDADT